MSDLRIPRTPIDVDGDPKVPHMCNGPGYCCDDGKGNPIEDALAQVTASLKTLRSECIRIAASLVRIYGELGRNEREVVDRETVVSIAMELTAASDGMRQPSRLVGSPHVRDPEFPCNEFVPGTPANGRCDGDGHYLCAQCVFHREDEAP